MGMGRLRVLTLAAAVQAAACSTTHGTDEDDVGTTPGIDALGLAAAAMSSNSRVQVARIFAGAVFALCGCPQHAERDVSPDATHVADDATTIRADANTSDAATRLDASVPDDVTVCSGEIRPIDERCASGCGVVVQRRTRPCASRVVEFFWCVEPVAPDPLTTECLAFEVDGVTYVFNALSTQRVPPRSRPCVEQDLTDGPGC